MEIITPAQYKTTNWKGGTTRQIFICPADGNLSARRFDLRISSAIIEQTESNFSDFSIHTSFGRRNNIVERRTTHFAFAQRVISV